MYSRYGSVSTVLDNFATFLTLMSRAYSDRSHGSSEPKSVPHGRVSATAFSPAIATELRLKSECRKLSHGTQTPAYAGNYLPSAESCAMAHTNPGPRTKQVSLDRGVPSVVERQRGRRADYSQRCSKPITTCIHNHNHITGTGPYRYLVQLYSCGDYLGRTPSYYLPITQPSNLMRDNSGFS